MQTFIYSIEHKDTHEIYYIGSCSRMYFSQRRADHTKIKEHNQDKYKTSILPVHRKIFEVGGWDYFEFKILHSCDKLDRVERMRLEQEYMNLYKPLYNVLNAIETIEDYRERKRLSTIKFRSAHPEYAKKYYNTPARLSYQKQRSNTKVDCPCGTTYHLNNKTHHLKTRRHADYLLTVHEQSIN